MELRSGSGTKRRDRDEARAPRAQPGPSTAAAGGRKASKPQPEHQLEQQQEQQAASASTCLELELKAKRTRGCASATAAPPSSSTAKEQQAAHGPTTRARSKKRAPSSAVEANPREQQPAAQPPEAAPGPSAAAATAPAQREQAPQLATGKLASAEKREPPADRSPPAEMANRQQGRPGDPGDDKVRDSGTDLVRLVLIIVGRSSLTTCPDPLVAGRRCVWPQLLKRQQVIIVHLPAGLRGSCVCAMAVADAAPLLLRRRLNCRVSSALHGLLRRLGAGFEDMMPMGGVSGSRIKVRGRRALIPKIAVPTQELTPRVHPVWLLHRVNVRVELPRKRARASAARSGSVHNSAHHAVARCHRGSPRQQCPPMAVAFLHAWRDCVTAALRPPCMRTAEHPARSEASGRRRSPALRPVGAERAAVHQHRGHARWFSGGVCGAGAGEALPRWASCAVCLAARKPSGGALGSGSWQHCTAHGGLLNTTRVKKLVCA